MGTGRRSAAEIAVRHEGHRRDAHRHLLVAHLGMDLVLRLGVFGAQVGHRDRLVDGRRDRAAGDGAELAAARVQQLCAFAHRHALQRDQADALDADAAGQLPADGVGAGIAAFACTAGPPHLLDGPVQPCFDRAGAGVDVMTVQAQPGLQAQRVARAEAGRPHLALRQQGKGLNGGHSGVEIHKERGAATKFITRLLYELQKNFDIRVSSIDSGSKHNAIPREAFAHVAVNPSQVTELVAFVKEHNSIIKNEYKSVEKNLIAFAEKIEKVERVMTKEFQSRLLNSFYAMPHGIIRWSPDIEGLVQTSTNFAVIETTKDTMKVLTSQRSSVETEKMNLANQIRAVIELGGGSVIQNDGYPSWEPNMDSSILNLAKEVHTKIFGFEPVIEAIHAGLECGLIGERYPHLDMLSFGPTIVGPHTPDEKVEIITVENTWKLLLGIIENLPSK